MKLWIISDLHLEFGETAWQGEAPDHDVVILAGDIHRTLVRGIEYAEKHFVKPVIYVAGNHEFYVREIEEELASARARSASSSNVKFLENEDIVIDGVHFIGCSMWTDFLLYGEAFKQVSCRTATNRMNDFRLIQERGADESDMRFTPARSIERHEQSRAFVERALKTHPNLPKVVVTHHAPHPKSVHLRYANSDMSGAFVSDLSSVIEEFQPSLWVHGHVHDRFDYLHGDTRVVCNPKGYEFERSGFINNFVVEI
jgi:Icc-related predicted phosphoesterase